MRNKHRPWLRFIEGPAGPAASQATQQADNSNEDGAQNSAPAVSEEPKDADFVDRYKQATGEKTVASEPAPEGDKADNFDEVAQLKAEMAALREQIDPLTKAQSARAEQERVDLTTSVAKAAGLPESMATRLHGETREQLEADAKNLAQVLGMRVVDPTQGAGAGAATRPTTLGGAIKAKIAAAGLK